DMVIADAYRTTVRILSPDIARTYTEHRARQKPEAQEDFEGALIEAREDIGALGLMQNLDVHFDAAAKQLSDEWLGKYRDPIKKLPDDRQDAYRQISALSREPQDVDMARPVSVWERTAVRETDGRETNLPSYQHHLLCDEHGEYPAELNLWEKVVLRTEMARTGFEAWYRNPNRPTQDSLGVAYVDGGETRIMRPDFLFFADLGKGKVVVDIVDPHGIHLADALPKLQGLATYASHHVGVFRRIWAVSEVGGKLRVLDLTKAEVQQALHTAESAKSLYESELAGDFV
ncbi:MAG: type III restriction endonuclease subunit R, partial [Thioalkalivibrio sp.]|nr:type III restriction endonuclease subunit R [Thioalkalivibrio sp.]